MKKSALFILCIVSLALCTVLLVPQAKIAASIGTGLGISSIQKKVDRLHKLGKKAALNAEELGWIRDLYRILATGAKASMFLPASSMLMFHYLDGSGDSLELQPGVFSQSDRVIDMKKKLAKKLCSGSQMETSPVFDMGGSTPFDSAFALYFGTLIAKKSNNTVTYIASMPWKWPTYDDIFEKYRSYEHEIFPIPNLLSLGHAHLSVIPGTPLYLPNALGGELEKVGLAKSFMVTSRWVEKLTC